MQTLLAYVLILRWDIDLINFVVTISSKLIDIINDQIHLNSWHGILYERTLISVDFRGKKTKRYSSFRTAISLADSNMSVHLVFHVLQFL